MKLKEGKKKTRLRTQTSQGGKLLVLAVERREKVKAKRGTMEKRHFTVYNINGFVPFCIRTAHE